MTIIRSRVCNSTWFNMIAVLLNKKPPGSGRSWFFSNPVLLRLPDPPSGKYLAHKDEDTKDTKKEAG